MKLNPTTILMMVIAPALAAVLAPTYSYADYLNDANTTVSLGAGMSASPFVNRGADESLASIVDAPNADAVENHTQQSHVWFSGEELNIVFRFNKVFDLSEFHFWNYTSEGYDVDKIELTFLNNALIPIVSAVIVDPEFGSVGSASGGITAQDFPLPVQGVRSVLASLSGSNRQVDFQNIGFTGTPSLSSSGGEDCLINAIANQYSLPSGDFALLSLPCVPPPGATVADVFADDIPGVLGDEWALYTFEPDSQAPDYRSAQLTDIVDASKGFWLIQLTDVTVVLDLPAGSKKHAANLATGNTCTGDLGCKTIALSGIEHPLSSDGINVEQAQWNIIPNPTSGSEPNIAFDDLRITSDTGACAPANQGCTPSEAFAANIMSNRLFSFNPSDGSYNTVTTGSTMRPWEGYWAAELLDAVDNEPTINYPKN